MRKSKEQAIPSLAEEARRDERNAMWQGEQNALQREATEIMERERMQSFHAEMNADLQRAPDEEHAFDLEAELSGGASKE